MVKHQPLQVYERQLLVSFVTGIYGCRWKRYQRSQDESSKVGAPPEEPLHCPTVDCGGGAVMCGCGLCPQPS